jgi:hypothetical protein
MTDAERSAPRELPAVQAMRLSSRPMGSSGYNTVNSQSGNAPARSGPIDYGGCAGCGKRDTFQQPR